MILKVENLNKSFPKFELKDVSFSLDKGYIMGFIGANGAGKTTTIKSIINLMHPESGNIEILGSNFKENEYEIKQKLAFVVGDSDYYPNKKLKNITEVVKRFYINWDDDKYNKYMKKFSLDDDKKIRELSSGMKVKFQITLALSYGAILFIFDEPTSGLDPVARDNLLELFQEIVEDGDKSILFSTHITSDLEKCADFITFIQNGSIIKTQEKDDFINSYRVINGTEDQLESIKPNLISYKKDSFGFRALIKYPEFENLDDYQNVRPSLDEIMIFHSKMEI
ncbi:MAG: ABC transporter ATP-binding protein [Spirochaetaceae bacterium]